MAPLKARPDVALDLPRMRHMSVGMTAYAEELAARLPHVAPDLSFATLVRTSALDAAEQIRLPLTLRRTRARLTHFLAVYAPALAPRPYVITIHDLIHLRFPQFFKRHVRPYYATLVRAVCAGAARVITDDERTIEDLERHLGVSPRKIDVIPLGVDDAYRTGDARSRSAERPYFLFVGNHRPHKDLPTLFSAWETLPASVPADLLVTGRDDLDPNLRRPQRERGRLRFIGDVDAAELARTYAGAVALVHPALREGFGLPMLEAAAAGCPVIACADAVPSVLQPYVATFAPRDSGALEALMRHALAQRPPTESARAFARSLSWDRCAARTADVYRTVLARENGRP